MDNVLDLDAQLWCESTSYHLRCAGQPIQTVRRGAAPASGIDLRDGPRLSETFSLKRTAGLYLVVGNNATWGIHHERRILSSWSYWPRSAG